MRGGMMSERDRKLLELAGVSVAEAAALVDRSRQAFYAGLKKQDSYLSTSDLVMLLLDARRRDASHLSQLLEFIDRDHVDGKVDKGLLIPGGVGIDQLLLACSGATRIVALVTSSEA